MIKMIKMLQAEKHPIVDIWKSRYKFSSKSFEEHIENYIQCKRMAKNGLKHQKHIDYRVKTKYACLRLVHKNKEINPVFGIFTVIEGSTLSPKALYP